MYDEGQQPSDPSAVCLICWGGWHKGMVLSVVRVDVMKVVMEVMVAMVEVVVVVVEMVMVAVVMVVVEVVEVMVVGVIEVVEVVVVRVMVVVVFRFKFTGSPSFPPFFLPTFLCLSLSLPPSGGCHHGDSTVPMLQYEDQEGCSLSPIATASIGCEHRVAHINTPLPLVSAAIPSVCPPSLWVGEPGHTYLC